MKKTFQFTACFMSGKTEADIKWVINAIASILAERSITSPQIIVTDRDKGLIKVMKRNLTFDKTPYILCR